MAVALFFDALAPLFPALAQSQGLSAAAFQTLLGGCYVAFALAQIGSVPIIAAFGLYRAVSLSCLALGVCVMGLCMAPNAMMFVGTFLAMFAINSVGSNATRVAMRNAAGEIAFKRLFAWANSAVELKQIVMPFLSGAIAGAAGWRWALVALVAPVVLVGIWIEAERIARPDKQAARPVDRSGWRTLLRDPRFLGPALTAAGFQFAFPALSARLPFVLAEQVDAPLSIGLVLSLSSAAIAAGLALTGGLASRLSSGALIRTGMALMAVGGVLVLAGSVRGASWTVVGIIAVQSAFGFIMIPASADALNVEEASRASAAALFGFLQPVVGGAVVALTGAVSSDHGSVVVALTLAALVAVGLSQRVKSIPGEYRPH